MAKELPFDDDVMTLIMGLGGSEEPGQHGRTMIPAPEQGPIDIITQIRDLCEDFLLTVDKDKKSEKVGTKSEKEPEEESEEESFKEE